MAGNIAHDFNNLLTTIMGFAGIIKRSHNLDADDRDNLALIEDAARRAADLTGRLLAFARGDLSRFRPVELRGVVTDTLRLCESTFSTGFNVTVDLPPDPVIIEGDESQLEQAVLNILLNARDALNRQGSITVGLLAHPGHATLTISDDGPGMDDDVRAHIFEPFFTTKPAGSGTGLGLAITNSIVQAHHGDITVDSRPGHGTTFTITLPTAAARRDGTPRGRPGAPYVLVVDDDELVRRTLTTTLAHLGCAPLEAADGRAALDILRSRPNLVSAVILDLVMPGLTGAETYSAIAGLRPGLPIVICTGYAADVHLEPGVHRRVVDILQKPITLERMAAALQAAGVDIAPYG